MASASWVTANILKLLPVVTPVGLCSAAAQLLAVSCLQMEGALMRFLRNLFAHKEQVWKPYCDDIGGRYLEGGFWQGDRIEIPHQAWTITLTVDTGDAECNFISTSLRAKIDPKAKLAPWLIRNWPGQKLLHLVRVLGLHEAEVPGLSEDCMVLAIDVGQAKTVFGNSELQALVNGQPELYLLIGLLPRLSRSGANEVIIMVPGVVEDLARLKSLLGLSRQVIDTASELDLIMRANTS